jgi:catechol 2,3-dioxygenase-like lactoylglutathione lyase family enzyme
VTSPVLNRGLDHIALRAYDIDATVEFYTQALGFRFLCAWSAPDRGVKRAVFLDAGDDRIIELFDAESTPPGGSARALDAAHRPDDDERGRSAVLVHFAIRTDDPVTLFERAVAAGARPLMAPTRIEAVSETSMTLHVGFIYGPNDEVIEFIQRDGFAGEKR